MRMTVTDKKIIKELDELKLDNLTGLTHSEEYCSYDASNGTSIVEFKYRRATYDTWMVEMMKLTKGFQKAALSGKQYYYLVMTDDTIFIWNLTKLLPGKQWSHSTQLCPATTDFNNKAKILKIVTYLDIKDCIHKINRGIKNDLCL